MRRRRASRANADTLRAPSEHLNDFSVSYSTSETRMLKVFVLRTVMLWILCMPSTWSEWWDQETGNARQSSSNATQARTQKRCVDWKCSDLQYSSFQKSGVAPPFLPQRQSLFVSPKQVVSNEEDSLITQVRSLATQMSYIYRVDYAGNSYWR
jgi:hypothetical protein